MKTYGSDSKSPKRKKKPYFHSLAHWGFNPSESVSITVQMSEMYFGHLITDLHFCSLHLDSAEFGSEELRDRTNLNLNAGHLRVYWVIGLMSVASQVTWGASTSSFPRCHSERHTSGARGLFNQWSSSEKPMWWSAAPQIGCWERQTESEAKIKSRLCLVYPSMSKWILKGKKRPATWLRGKEMVGEVDEGEAERIVKCQSIRPEDLLTFASPSRGENVLSL